MKIKVEDFNLQYTLESGQCFNFNKVSYNKYSGVIKDKFITIEQVNDILKIDSFPNIKEIEIREYFNLDINYENILIQLAKDKNISKIIEKYRGLRVINQDEYECMFSYIISSFNSIQKIKKTIAYLSKHLGERITGDVYSFPNIEKLKNADIKILREAKLGYRDKYIKESAFKIINENIDIYDIKNLDYTTAKKKLKEFPGIGDKVADCTMLYSMNFHNAFPIDTWINKYLTFNFKNNKEGKEILQKKFNGFSGWAQLFIFTDIRSIKNI
jgi:N-glycosylase/DNA lyase